VHLAVANGLSDRITLNFMRSRPLPFLPFVVYKRTRKGTSTRRCVKEQQVLEKASHPEPPESEQVMRRATSNYLQLHGVPTLIGRATAHVLHLPFSLPKHLPGTQENLRRGNLPVILADPQPAKQGMMMGRTVLWGSATAVARATEVVANVIIVKERAARSSDAM